MCLVLPDVIVVPGGPLLGYTIGQIFANHQLYIEYRDRWAPGIWYDIVSCLSAGSLYNEGDWDPGWMAGLMDESPRDVSLYVGRQGMCRWCTETPCYARKYLPIFLMHLPNLCYECAWIDGESITDWRLRYIRKRLYQLIRQVDEHDPFRRDPTVGACGTLHRKAG